MREHIIHVHVHSGLVSNIKYNIKQISLLSFKGVGWVYKSISEMKYAVMNDIPVIIIHLSRLSNMIIQDKVKECKLCVLGYILRQSIDFTDAKNINKSDTSYDKKEEIYLDVNKLSVINTIWCIWHVLGKPRIISD